MAIEVKVPDIGDFKDVPIIEVHVKPGDTVKADDPLITLEIRQGDDGGAGARRGMVEEDPGQDRRQGQRGHADRAAEGRRRGDGRSRLAGAQQDPAVRCRPA